MVNQYSYEVNKTGNQSRPMPIDGDDKTPFRSKSASDRGAFVRIRNASMKEQAMNKSPTSKVVFKMG